MAIVADARLLAATLWGAAPKPMPRNLRRADAEQLDPSEYVCAPKTDGERVALVLGATEAEDRPYLVAFNRAMRGSEMPLREGVVDELGALPRGADAFCGTLLDAERLSDGALVVFDAVAVCGYDVRGKPFEDRLEAARPVVEALGEGVALKRWRPLAQIAEAYDEPGPPRDGVVVMPAGAAGQAPIYKWKEALKNTLDFQWRQGGWWMAGGGRDGAPQAVGALGIEVDKLAEKNRRLEEGAIYECAPRRVAEGRRLFDVLHRRDDKTRPNHQHIVASTLASIEEGLGLDELAQRFDAPRSPKSAPPKRRRTAESIKT